MAGEEDVELRDLVAQSLEAKGVLGKIRAQLRANVFLALEEQESKDKPHPFVGEKLQNFQKTKEGRQAIALVREFLEYFKLDFTTAVFDPETNACESYPGRERLARDLGVESDSDMPLLATLLQRPHTQSHPPTSSLHLTPHAATFPTSLSHHTSHPHITNGNALPPLTSDPTLSRPHQTTVAVSTAVNPVAIPTAAVTSTVTTTTAGGGEPLSSKLSPQDVPTQASATETRQVLSSSTVGRSGLDNGGEATLFTEQDIDDFFSTLPPPPSTLPPPSNHPSDPTREDSDGSIPESLEDSISGAKATDVTHTDYDNETSLMSQEQ